MWQCPECTFVCEMDGQCKCGFLLGQFEDITSLLKEVEIEPCGESQKVRIIQGNKEKEEEKPQEEESWVCVCKYKNKVDLND